MKTDVIDARKIFETKSGQIDCDNCAECSEDTNAPRHHHNTPLDMVLRYHNNAVIQRIVKEMELSQLEAAKLFEDTLTFLWLAAKFGSVVPSPLIDEGWHTFLLFTKDYAKFCQDHFGFFLHHRPRRPEDKPDGGKMRARTHTLISEHLGDNLGPNWNYGKLGKGDCEQSCAPSYDCH